MSCESCKTVQYLLENDTWLHVGTGCLTNVQYNIVPDLLSLDLSDYTLTTNVFTHKDAPLGKGIKPNNSVWFSAGRWSFDPYHDYPECDSNGHESIYGEFLAIKNPVGILHVKDLKDIEQFAEKYAVKKLGVNSLKARFIRIETEDFTQESEDIWLEEKCEESGIDYNTVTGIIDPLIEKYLSKNLYAQSREEELAIKLANVFGKDEAYFEEWYDALRYYFLEYQCEKLELLEDDFEPDPYSIDWDLVAKDWNGVAFHFKKVADLDPAKWKKYYWHTGFDVETLVVWNLTVFENSAVPIKVK